MDDSWTIRWSSPDPNRGAPGFSLVELMIVVALIGLLAGIGVWTVAQTTERTRVADMNRAVVNGFSEARQFAMQQNQAVFVEIPSAGDTDAEITFFQPTNWGSAFTCGLAQGAGAGAPEPDDDRTLNHISFADFGIDNMQVDHVDPGNLPAQDVVCIAPNGRVFDTNGQTLGGGQCDGMNLVIGMVDADAGADSANLYCGGDGDELAVERELANFSLIHIGYSGQVRVIR